MKLRSEFGVTTKTLERHLMENRQQGVSGTNPGPPRVIDIKKYLAGGSGGGGGGPSTGGQDLWVSKGGSSRDNVSPSKSTTGIPGLSSSGLPDYLSDVETNPGGRMYRTESGRICFWIEIV